MLKVYSSDLVLVVSVYDIHNLYCSLSCFHVVLLKHGVPLELDWFLNPKGSGLAYFICVCFIASVYNLILSLSTTEVR